MECIKGHTELTRSITILAGEDLLRWLRTYKMTDRLVRDQLLMNSVRHILVDYEKLYLGDNVDEWMRIFSFLERGPMKNLTMDDVRAHFSMAPTYSKCRTDVISNYDEVEDTLKDTEFQHLLYG